MSEIKCSSLPSSDLAYTNKIYLSPSDYQSIKQQFGTEPVHLELNDFVFTVEPHNLVREGIAMSKFQREMAMISLVDNLSPRFFYPPDGFFLGSIRVEVTVLQSSVKGLEVQEEVFDGIAKNALKHLVLNENQQLLVDFQGIPMKLRLSDLQLIDFQNASYSPSQRGILHDTTQLKLSSTNESVLSFQSSQMRTMNIFEGNSFNFEELGIGGLDKEFQQIFRRAFASRLFPAQVMKRLGISHVKGMLLHGPPGTGKTLIARQIAKCLRAHEPKIVNGPELFDKYVGQTEQNIRELFKDAELEQETKGDKSQLHIIIFDEFDALCRTRGSTQSGTGVHDSAVNQLLSKIDGVEALNNILVIGMSNRKDMIDPAVLRPGRLEVHVEVGLPEEDGRQQILRIHTKQMKESGALAPDVDLAELAKLTNNYSGAELESLVKNAASFALHGHIDLNDLGREVDMESLVITREHFMESLKEVQPAFGVDSANLERYFSQGIFDYGPRYQQLVSTFQSLINQVRTSETTPILSLLLEGPSGSGKTALASYLAIQSGFPFVKLVSAENFVRFSEIGKVNAIAEIFEDAYKSSLSMIILDEIERLIDYVDIGPRFSNTILQAILVLCKKLPQNPGRRIMIIGTTSNPEFLRDLALTKSFNVVLEVPKLDEAIEISNVLRQYPCPKSEIERIARESGPISIKHLILAIGMSLQGVTKVTYERFMECLRSITF